MSENLIVSTTQRVLEHVTTKHNVIDILGEKRSDIYSELDKSLKDEFSKYGVEYVSITIIDMDAGKKLEAAITAEAVAKKEVETAEQKLLKTQAEAKQEAIKAQAAQDAAKIKAETKVINAKATKEANELINKSLNDDILQKQWIEKWNGKMPTYYGGDGGLMFNVGNSESKKEK
jgi:regulator of protease activity HflC (stomatin/prohibitin superfamily)